MTNEDWKYVEDTLLHLGSAVYLKIDGYKVTLMVEPYKKLQNCIAVYVNDKIQYQRYKEPQFQHGGFIRRDAVRAYADRLIEQFDVRSGQSL